MKQSEQPKNIYEAFYYVTERYVFNEENYPGIEDLTEPRKSYFSLKHILLHFLKNSVAFHSIFKDEKQTELDFSQEHKKEAFVKIWINILVMINLLKDNSIFFVTSIESKILLDPSPVYGIGGDFSEFFSFMVKILEQADHGKTFSYKELDDNVRSIVYNLLKVTNKSFPNVWEEIPNYMKSK